jgi:L-rhamnose isomerase/sugar isomerase
MDAYDTDVRPLLRDMRADMKLDPDPMAAFARSDYSARVAAERAGGQQAGWGA